MKALIVVLPLLIVMAVSYTVGWWAGRASARNTNDRNTLLNRGAVLEAQSLMNLRERLAIQASEHMILGESFPAIVLDEINKQRRELESK